MTAPITPDERSVMRAIASGLRVLSLNAAATSAELAYATDVPRLLDALDTAEAEVALLRAEIRRDLARFNGPTRSTPARPAPTQGDDLGQSYCPVHGDLLAGERSWRCANAAPGHERLAPPPVWDEDTVTEAVARATALVGDYDGCFERLDAWADASDEARECGDVEEPLSTDAEDAEFWHSRARAVLAVVREHLPVRPDREDVARALWRQTVRDNAMHDESVVPWDEIPTETREWWCVYADAVLALWPGESRATVQAEALRDWISEWPTTPGDGTFLADVARDGLARADRLEKGADRG